MSVWGLVAFHELPSDNSRGPELSEGSGSSLMTVLVTVDTGVRPVRACRVPFDNSRGWLRFMFTIMAVLVALDANVMGTDKIYIPAKYIGQPMS
jgi:hypothetical protein